MGPKRYASHADDTLRGVQAEGQVPGHPASVDHMQAAALHRQRGDEVAAHPEHRIPGDTARYHEQ